MRVVLDLQACQTHSRRRGIGRYSEDLTRALLDQAGDSELILGLDGTYPQEMRQVVASLGAGLVPGNFLRYYYPGPNQPHGHPADGLRPAAEQLVRAAYASLGADVVHVNSLFEGYVEHAAGLDRLSQLSGTVSSVTLYDLIPLRLPETYLADPVYRAWYQRKLESLRKFDILLCISDATRRDAVELLEIPEERLAVIGAGVSPIFRPAADLATVGSKIRAKYRIKGRFVLYTGNGDYRKNLKGAVSAFAELPSQVRRTVQLVLNQVGDEASILSYAKSVGLSRDDLVITGWIPDGDLVELLQTCTAFFFPTLYEGFGLPVIEAMACGAPAIASNNSSLPEIVGRSDALFDVSVPGDVTRVLNKVLTDNDFRTSLSESGRVQAKGFSWSASAQRSLRAWGEALDRRRRALPSTRKPTRPKLALVTPMPPQQTGIADYVSELLPELCRLADVELFTDLEKSTPKYLEGGGVARSWKELRSDVGRFEHVIYQVGNSPFHSHMIDLIYEVPGLVVLHDFFLSSMLWHKQSHEGHPGVFREALYHGHGVPALAVHDNGDESKLEARRLYPASRRMIEAADGLIVHSSHSGALCREFYPGVRRGPWTVLPMPIRSRKSLAGEERAAARRRLRVHPDEFLVVSLGFMADTKLNIELLKAIELLRPDLQQRVRVVFVGHAAGGDYGRSVENTISMHPAAGRVVITGFASPDVYDAYIGVADCAVQLRASSRGETSKAVLDCLAAGVPTIVNAYGALAEIPDDAVVKVGLEAGPAELAQALTDLINRPALRSALSGSCLEYISTQHSPASVAEAYLSAACVSQRWRHEARGEELALALAEGVHAGKLSACEVDAIERDLSATVDAVRDWRLLVDVTEVVTSDHGTGIHRVVRNFARELSLLPVCTGPATVLVAHDSTGKLNPATHWGSASLGLPEPVVGSIGGHHEIRAGDSLLMIDSAWQDPDRFRGTISLVQAGGGRAVAMVYDLIPIQRPEYCVDFMPAVFERWLRFVVLHCDDLICISRAVADDLASWIRREKVAHRSSLRIGHVMLGSDLREVGSDIGAQPSTELATFLEKGGKVTLMVGTVEPRKRNDLALRAFEALWQHGQSDRLLIIGRQGWNVESLADEIRSHSEFGSRLGWLSSASDADVSAAYAASYRVLQASDAEGFGLPIVEALRHGCPLLISDIPVFREVAGAKAEYFEAGSLASLIEALRLPAREANGLDVRPPTWSECAVLLRAQLAGSTWDHKL